MIALLLHASIPNVLPDSSVIWNLESPIARRNCWVPKNVPESLRSVPTNILITQLSLSKETSISGSIESAFASCFASSMSSSDGFDPTIVTQPLPTDFNIYSHILFNNQLDKFSYFGSIINYHNNKDNIIFTQNPIKLLYYQFL